MNYPKKILILFAHPALHKSRVNQVLARQARRIAGVTFHDLYATYPEFDFLVTAEQDLLEAHDVIVFQFPFFWYSSPAIIKEWTDLVLIHGWAYGSEGKALEGKWVMHAITTGGRESAYHSNGLNRFTVREFLRPFEQTAVLCNMKFVPPFVVHGTHQMKTSDIQTHADTYRSVIRALRDDRFDIHAAERVLRINEDLSSIIRAREEA